MPYNVVQTAFKLSRSANGADNETGTPAQLQDHLRTELRKILVETEVQAELVWGPCVFQSDRYPNEHVADQSMYVARIPRFNTYVVAVAGTNFKSTYAQQQLDLNVRETVPFPAGVNPDGISIPTIPNGGRISAGTGLGVTNLLEMQDSSAGSLQTFLQRSAASDATLVFAGHSLGGALAPTLALWLYPTPASSGWKNVRVLATAAPSPGDVTFSAAFGRAYPQAGESTVTAEYGVWNAVIWNQWDLVPHTWTNMFSLTTDQTNIVWDVEIEGLQYPTKAISLYGVLSAIALKEPMPKNIVQTILAKASLVSDTHYARLPNYCSTAYPHTPGIVLNFELFLVSVSHFHIRWYDQLFDVHTIISKSDSPELGISVLSSVPAPAKV